MLKGNKIPYFCHESVGKLLLSYNDLEGSSCLRTSYTLTLSGHVIVVENRPESAQFRAALLEILFSPVKPINNA